MGVPRWILVSDKASTWPIHFYGEEPPQQVLEETMKRAEFSFQDECYLCRVEKVRSALWRSRS